MYRSIQEIVTFHSPSVIPTAVIIMVQDRIKIWTFYLTAPTILISLLATTFTPFTWSTKIFEPDNLKSFQITTQNFEWLIIKMQTFIVLFTLLKFSSVVMFAWIQEVIIGSKIYSWYTPRVTKLLCFLYEFGERGARWEIFHLYFLYEWCNFRKKVFKFCVNKRCKIRWKYILKTIGNG